MHIIALILALWSLPAFAQESTSIVRIHEPTPELDETNLNLYFDSLRAGLQVANFDYQEPSLMKQKGTLSGVSLVGTQFSTWSDWRFTEELELMTGATHYDGSLRNLQTNQSYPYSTDGNDITAELRLTIGRNFIPASSTVLTPFAGVATRWLNDKQKGYGTYERTISYYYLPVGVDVSRLSGAWVVGAHVEYDVFASGAVKSNMSDVEYGMPDMTNRQYNGRGYRASVSITRKFETVSLRVEPFIRHWEVSESEPYEFVRDRYRYTFVEPENRTEMVGLNLAMGL